ncbi:MAG: GNAT family N-acetyltransferase [Candidatus Neomarinimicrobiota bacterium]
MTEYPSDFEFDIVLRDGGVARFRPVKKGDTDSLKHFFGQVGPASRYFRFFRSKKDLTKKELAHFAEVDYEKRMAFVGMHEGKIVGVGGYEQTTDDSGTAEIAFLVRDDHQGRGIGTQLLQLLTRYARRREIARFRAFVLPDNVRMLRVLTDSGYRLERTLDDGVYAVTFPLIYSKDARVAEEEREKQAVASSLLPIFYPRSIAVIGASRDRESVGGRLFGNLLNGNFNGPIYPVNPNARVVSSVRAYPSILDIPDPVDLAFIVVPSKFTTAVVQECAKKGVKGLVTLSAGFSEIGEDGEVLEKELLEVVRSAGMRMVGPNCMGLLNTDPNIRLNGTFAPIHPPRGNVGMSSQSGALGIAILDYSLRNNIGISTFVSVGNKADISGNDLLLYWEDDHVTDVIVLYLESFGNPRKFVRIARRISKKKPIIAVKSGRTKAGTRAALSHTGALASLDVAVSALFNQAGVIRTNTMEELFDLSMLLANQPVPRGKRVGVVTNAGGPGILAADSIESNGLEVPELSPSLQKEIRKHLSPEASARNPVDLIASAGPKEYRHCLESMITSDEVDAIIAIFVPTSDERSVEVASILRDVAARHKGEKTLLSVFMSSSEAAMSQLKDEEIRIPTYRFPEAASWALARAARYGEWRRKPEGEVPEFEDLDEESARSIVSEILSRLGEEGGWLQPDEVERLFASFGIPVPKSVVAATEDQAVEAAKKLGGPVAMKVVSPTSLHKSDVGGVALDVRSEESIRSKHKHLMSTVNDSEGVLIQEMVPGGHEILIGMTEDPSFGPLIVFGLGGVYVELMGDVAFRIHPLTDLDAAEMIEEIKSARLLHGYRSFPQGDIPAVRETLLRVSALVEAVPEIAEMDINPLKVLAPGEGVKAVDARIRIKPMRQGWSPELSDIRAAAG